LKNKGGINLSIDTDCVGFCGRCFRGLYTGDKIYATTDGSVICEHCLRELMQAQAQKAEEAAQAEKSKAAAKEKKARKFWFFGQRKG
jgi:hypothetical protein